MTANDSTCSGIIEAGQGYYLPLTVIITGAEGYISVGAIFIYNAISDVTVTAKATEKQQVELRGSIAEDGMTWREFVESEYNTGGFFIALFQG